MSERLKWMVALCGVVVFTVAGLTALGGYDEQTCRQTPTTRVKVVRNPVYDSIDDATGPPVFIRGELPRSVTVSCRGEVGR